MPLASHLPAIQVVLPLVAAPACVFVYRSRLAWALATAVSWAALAIAAALLRSVIDDGPISYALGGWAAPWGIEYRIDKVNAFVLVIVTAISAVVLPFARDSVEREVRSERIYLFYTAWMLCLTGMLGIVVTGDAFNVFVFLEISSLSSYVLISLARDRRALLAAFRYLVMGTIGATFILIAIGLLYAMTGTLNMADMAERLATVGDTRTVKTAFGFLTVGIGLKMALFPLHAWLPGAYAYAPSSVTALLAGTATKVAVYVLLRFVFSVFGANFAFEVMFLDRALLPLALAAVLAASAIAIIQADVKRMLAWSSIAQIGYMVLGVSLVSVTGLTATIIHLFNHALMKSALFLALGCVFYRVGAVSLDAMRGLGRQMPWTMAAFVAGSLSLIGVPLTAGFISKWYLLQGALQHGGWPLAAPILVASLLALAYTGRVIEAAYFRRAKPGAIQGTAREAPLSLLVPVWILIGANVYFGVRTELTVGVARSAAAALLGVPG